MPPPRKLRVAIVGGGIGRLTMAVALSKLQLLDDHIQLDIYESTKKLTQIGAGIMMWPRGWEILRSFGLEASLAEKMSPGHEVPSSGQIKTTFTFRRSDMKEGIPIVKVMMPGGSVAFHRADVQEVLLKHISPSVNLHLSRRLSRYCESEDGVELEFKNGTKAVCDLMIGADGINSVVRKNLLAQKNGWSEEEASWNSEPLWTGCTVYRNTLDAESVRRDCPNHRALTSPLMYLGKNKAKHVVAYPILQGKLINAVPWLSDYSKEGTHIPGPVLIENSTDNFAPQYEGWEDEVQVLLKHMLNPTRWEIQNIAPLDSYISTSGSVVLLGDAVSPSLLQSDSMLIAPPYQAHAAPPHLGNGAGQAIEDAYILSNLLAKAIHSGTLDLPKLAKIYDTIRQPFGNFAAAGSVKLGRYLDLHAPGFGNIKDGDEVAENHMKELGKLIEACWGWTYQSARPDLERALQSF